MLAQYITKILNIGYFLKMKTFIYILILMSTIKTAIAKEIVLDGDSLRFGKKDIRLMYIDAPEYKQYCYDFRGFEYDCGQASKEALKKIINNRFVDCERKSTDIYKRDLSVCFVDGLNINLEMIKQGWAIVYRGKNNNEYIEAENEAKKEGLGLWQGKFMKPELHRALNRK